MLNSILKSLVGQAGPLEILKDFSLNHLLNYSSMSHVILNLSFYNLLYDIKVSFMEDGVEIDNVSVGKGSFSNVEKNISSFSNGSKLTISVNITDGNTFAEDVLLFDKIDLQLNFLPL